MNLKIISIQIQDHSNLKLLHPYHKSYHSLYMFKEVLELEMVLVVEVISWGMLLNNLSI